MCSFYSTSCGVYRSQMFSCYCRLAKNIQQKTLLHQVTNVTDQWKCSRTTTATIDAVISRPKGSHQLLTQNLNDTAKLLQHFTFQHFYQPSSWLSHDKWTAPTNSDIHLTRNSNCKISSSTILLLLSFEFFFLSVIYKRSAYFGTLIQSTQIWGKLPRYNGKKKH